MLRSSFRHAEDQWGYSLCQCLLFLWIPSEIRALLKDKMPHTLYTTPLKNGTVDPDDFNPISSVFPSGFTKFRSRN